MPPYSPPWISPPPPPPPPPPSCSPQFDQYADSAVVPHIVMQLKRFTRNGVVWDTYITDSINLRHHKRKASDER